MSLRRILFGFIALTLVLSACGDGGGGDGDTDLGADANTDSGDSDNADNDDGDTDDGDVPAGAFLDEDCNFLLAGIFLNPFAAIAAGTGEFDSDEFEAQREQFAAIAEDAPDEIADSMALIQERNEEFAELVDGVDFSDPNAFTDPDLQQALAEAGELFDDEYNEASEDVTAFAAAECDLTAGANN